jgi:hypothetical protein
MGVAMSGRTRLEGNEMTQNERILAALQAASTKLSAGAMSAADIGERLVAAHCRATTEDFIAFNCPLALWYRRELQAAGVLEASYSVGVGSTTVEVFSVPVDAACTNYPASVLVDFELSPRERIFRVVFDDGRSFPELQPQRLKEKDDTARSS